MIQFRHDRAQQALPCARIVQHSPRLIDVVEQAITQAGVSPSRFGRDAVNDPALVANLRAGRRPRLATRTAILAHAAAVTGKAVARG